MGDGGRGDNRITMGVGASHTELQDVEADPPVQLEEEEEEKEEKYEEMGYPQTVMVFMAVVLSMVLTVLSLCHLGRTH